MPNSDTYTFLYLEDCVDVATRVLVGRLKNETLDIDLNLIASFEKQFDKITSEDKYQGLLIDLKLNERPGEGNVVVKYTAPTLAQAIRSFFSSITVYPRKEFPIVLFTSDQNIKGFMSDFSSHDLFDLIFDKNEIDKFTQYSKELLSLVKGYQKINSMQDVNIIELLEAERINDLDQRILDGFGKSRESTWKYVSLVLHDIILKPSMLINEELLAARLGVDIEQSNGWNKILEYFSEAKYHGIFSDGWDRWWMSEVNELFEKLSQGIPLAHLSAERRSYILSEALHSEIVPPTPINYCRSTRFWTLCQKEGKPLDPDEGFRLNEIKMKPWIEDSYISFDALLNSDSDQLLDPIENKRFNLMKNEIETEDKTT